MEDRDMSNQYFKDLAVGSTFAFPATGAHATKIDDACARIDGFNFSKIVAVSSLEVVNAAKSARKRQLDTNQNNISGSCAGLD